MKSKIQNRIKWLEREIKRLKEISGLTILGQYYLSGRLDRLTNEQKFLIELLEADRAT